MKKSSNRKPKSRGAMLVQANKRQPLQERLLSDSFFLVSNASRFTERLFPRWRLRDRHHRQGGEDAVAEVHFQDHSAEQSLPHRIAAH